MRCLSIARKLRSAGCRVIFIAADEETAGFIRERNPKMAEEIICLHSVWNDLGSELPDMCRLIKERNIEKLLIDDYFVTEQYLSELNSITEVTYIDDLAAFPYPVSRLINYNIYADEAGYLKLYGDEGKLPKLLLGPSYAPLRDEFEGVQPRSFSGINKILITSGGTDNLNMLGNILHKLKASAAFKNKTFYCVMGAFNVNRQTLEAEYGTDPSVHLLYNIPNMGDYMKSCDICITAGGSTTYELCACGLPSVMYTLADNQLGIAKGFSEAGLIPYAGDVREDMDGCLERILQEIEGLNDGHRWMTVSSKMQSLVDGCGAARIAEAIK